MAQNAALPSSQGSVNVESDAKPFATTSATIRSASRLESVSSNADASSLRESREHNDSDDSDDCEDRYRESDRRSLARATRMADMAMATMAMATTTMARTVASYDYYTFGLYGYPYVYAGSYGGVSGYGSNGGGYNNYYYGSNGNSGFGGNYGFSTPYAHN